MGGNEIEGEMNLEGMEAITKKETGKENGKSCVHNKGERGL